ncbi:hypothetical protein D3C76_1034430 [compost metagenome]
MPPPELATVLVSGSLQFRLERRLGNHSLGLALFQAVPTLSLAEKTGQDDAGQPFEQCGKVPEYRFDAVVQGQGNNTDVFIAQALLAVHHFGIKRRVVELRAVAPQCHGMAPALGMTAQGTLEAFHFRRHGWFLRGPSAVPGD